MSDLDEAPPRHPMDNVEHSVGLGNMLNIIGIRDLEDLSMKTEAELHEGGCNRAHITEIKKILAEHDLRLDMGVSEEEAARKKAEADEARRQWKHDIAPQIKQSIMDILANAGVEITDPALERKVEAVLRHAAKRLKAKDNTP
ncbi:MAG: hypothetical protein KGI97_02385 [Alphaproteobacteria bacterium]|nr:hypothetical protein [Alphaproteobacteria bacterium]